MMKRYEFVVITFDFDETYGVCQDLNLTYMFLSHEPDGTEAYRVFGTHYDVTEAARRLDVEPDDIYLHGSTPR